jgi:hypothetical protein
VTFPADTNGHAADPNSIVDLADEFTVDLVRTYDVTTSTTELIVEFPRGTYEVDPASLSSNGADEFVLSGAAASGVTLTYVGQVEDDEHHLIPGRFSYTASGFGDGEVVLSFIPGSWWLLDRSVGAVPPTVTLNTHAGDTTIDITFPADSKGHSIAPESLTDAAEEFELAGAGLGSATITGTPTLKAGTQRTYTYSLSQALGAGAVTATFNGGTWSLVPLAVVPDTPKAPTLEEGEYRFVLKGDFGAGDQTQMTFAAASWSVVVPFADLTGFAGQLTILDGDKPAENHTYVDVVFRMTAAAAKDEDASLADIGGDEFSITGMSFVSGEGPLALGNGKYRYFLEGDFAPGTVSVEFPAGRWSQTGGLSNIAETEAFTVLGPPPSGRPADGARPARR